MRDVLIILVVAIAVAALVTGTAMVLYHPENAWELLPSINVASLITAIATALVALFTWLVWKLHHRQTWLTGAMASHSQMMVRLAALDHGIETVWWDPTAEKPPVDRKHGEVAKINKIYIYVPLSERKHQSM